MAGVALGEPDVTRHAVGVASPRMPRALLGWLLAVLTGSALVLVGGGDAAPLHAPFDPVVGGPVALAVGVGAFLAFVGPRLAVIMSWRRLVPACAVAAFVWSVALASTRGWDRIVSPVRSRFEYLAVLPRVHGLGGFLAGYVDRLATYPVHVQGHPPGAVVALWLLRGVGLGGAGPAAMLFVAGGALAAPAVLVAARDVAGESWARRAAPFVVMAPVAIWVATSADALFAGVATWGVALVIVATGRHDRRGDAAAAVGGTLLGVSVVCSYGLVLIGLIPLVVAVHRRRARPVALAVLGAGAVLGAFLAAGFWWLDGLLATRSRYLVGISTRRPYPVYLVANLSAFAIALGPATTAGLARLRAHGLRLLIGAALVAVLLADLSGLSKGEVERIWIPFTPWVLLSGAALWQPGARGASRRCWWGPATVWLGAQAVTAILVESVVRTPW